MFCCFGLVVVGYVGLLLPGCDVWIGMWWILVLVALRLILLGERVLDLCFVFWWVCVWLNCGLMILLLFGGVISGVFVVVVL